MSEGQKRAWFEELKADFPGLPDEFIRIAVDAFEKEPHIYIDLFRNEKKRQAKEAKAAKTAGHIGVCPLPPSESSTRRVTVAQLEEQSAKFKVQLEAIERDSKMYVIKAPIIVEDKENDEARDPDDVGHEAHQEEQQQSTSDVHG